MWLWKTKMMPWNVTNTNTHAHTLFVQCWFDLSTDARLTAASVCFGSSTIGVHFKACVFYIWQASNLEPPALTVHLSETIWFPQVTHPARWVILVYVSKEEIKAVLMCLFMMAKAAMSQNEFMTVIHTIHFIWHSERREQRLICFIWGMKVRVPPLLVLGVKETARVNPSSISPMWGMQTVAVPMGTPFLCCYGFRTFCWQMLEFTFSSRHAL